jgi:hypothetical protein
MQPSQFACQSLIGNGVLVTLQPGDDFNINESQSPPFFDVLLPLIAKAEEARVLAVISTIAVIMAVIAKVVVVVFIHILLTTLSSYI